MSKMPTRHRAGRYRVRDCGDERALYPMWQGDGGAAITRHFFLSTQPTVIGDFRDYGSRVAELFAALNESAFGT
jgi:hypothetical protein